MAGNTQNCASPCWTTFACRSSCTAHIENGIDRGGLVIGESCNAYFDPHQFGLVTTPGDVGCDENAKPVR
jgi:hypothetical protein